MQKGQPTFAAFLFLFLLTPGSQYCPLSTVDECKAAVPVPGHSIIGSGFDITTMERTLSSILDMNHKYTNGTCHLCRNTFKPEGAGQLQTIALNIDSWATISKFRSDITYSAHSSLISMADMQEKEYGTEWSRGIKIPVPKIKGSIGFIFSGSHSVLVQHVQGQSKASNNVYFSHDVHCTYYRFGACIFPPIVLEGRVVAQQERTCCAHMQNAPRSTWSISRDCSQRALGRIHLRPDPVITGRFQNLTNSLPADYNCYTKEEYLRVIKHHGTHFIKSVVLGGRARTVTSVEQCSMSISQLSTTVISNCLAVGVTATVGAGLLEGSHNIKGCLTQQEQNSYKKKSHLLEMHSTTIVSGGNQYFAKNALAGKGGGAAWVNSVRDNPAVISQEITPIHELLPQNSPQRDNLQKALIDYITQRALKVDCVNKCPGQQGSSGPQKDCHCTCDTSGFLNEICCPRHRFSGNMTVWIDRGKNLYGDRFGGTDAFVQVTFQGVRKETHVVLNNDNPIFGKTFNMGDVLLIPNSGNLTITVLDVDYWGREELGSCKIEVHAGPIQRNICVLSNGHLELRYKVQCKNSLEGSKCEQLSRQSPTFSSILPG